MPVVPKMANGYTNAIFLAGPERLMSEMGGKRTFARPSRLANRYRRGRNAPHPKGTAGPGWPRNHSALLLRASKCRIRKGRNVLVSRLFRMQRPREPYLQPSEWICL